jgi:hypothetical protein
LQTGVIQAAAGFYTHFVVMNDYGIKPATLFGLSIEKGVKPNSNDVYNPLMPQKGNTNYGASEEAFDYITDTDNDIDLRLFYFKHDVNDWSDCRWRVSSSAPRWWRHNLVEDVEICYSSEALRYAQCAYLVSIVTCQVAELLICKSRNLSMSQQGMRNNFANFGLIFEVVLISALCYIPWLNIALGTRMLASPHFAVPSFPFFAVIFFYDEGRKSLVRAGIDKETNKIHGWVAQNTYY